MAMSNIKIENNIEYLKNQENNKKQKNKSENTDEKI